MRVGDLWGGNEFGFPQYLATGLSFFLPPFPGGIGRIKIAQLLAVSTLF